MVCQDILLAGRHKEMKVVGLKIRARNATKKFYLPRPLSLAHALEDTNLLYLLVSTEDILAWILSYSRSLRFLSPDSPSST